MDDPADSDADPLSKLRRLAGRLVDEIVRLQEQRSGGLSFEAQFHIARTLTLLTPIIDQLFAPETTPPPKTGDQLREEDDALRAEFERRLASLLRGWEIAGSLGTDPERGSPPNAAGLAQLDASAPTGAAGQRLAPVAHPRRPRLG